MQKSKDESKSVYKESERLSNPTKKGIAAVVQPSASSTTPVDPPWRQPQAGQPRQRNRGRGKGK